MIRQLALIFLMLVWLTPAGALPNFNFSDASGFVGEDGVRVQVRFNDDGSDSITEGAIQLRYDAGVFNLAGEDCRDRVGGFISTHTVTCDVSNTTSTITISFDPLNIPAQTLRGNIFLGELVFDVSIFAPTGTTLIPSSVNFMTLNGSPVNNGNTPRANVDYFPSTFTVTDPPNPAQISFAPTSVNLTPNPLPLNDPPPTDDVTISNTAAAGAFDITSLNCNLLDGSVITVQQSPTATVSAGNSTTATLACSTANSGMFTDTYRCDYDLDGQPGLEGPTDIPVSCTIEDNQPPVLSTPLPAYRTSVGENLLIDVTPFFTDPEGDSLSFTLGGGSSFAMDDPQIPGLVVGTTTATDQFNSPLNLTLTPTDDQGNSGASTVLTILVENDVTPFFDFERYFPALQQPWYFAGISDLQSGADETVYVADSVRGRVSRYSRDGLLITQWGRLGTADGEFSFLSLRVATDAMGRVFTVSDSRLQVFSKNGVLLNVTDVGQTLLDISVDDLNRLYLLLADRVELRAADTPGLVLDSISINRTPGSVHVDAFGRIHIAQRSAGSNDPFDEIRTLDPAPDGGWFNGPTFSTVDADDLGTDSSGSLYVVGNTESVIRAYDRSGIEVVANDISAISAHPLRALSFDARGRFYIADNRQVFGVEGNSAVRSFAWQSASGEAARFDRPLDLATDAADNIYVVEASQSRVQKFTREGAFLPLDSWPLQQPVADPANAAVFVYATADSPTRVLVSTGTSIETYDDSGNLVTPDPFSALNLVAPGPVSGTPSGRLLISETDGPGTTFFVTTRTGEVVNGPWSAPQCRVSDATVGLNNLVHLLCEPGASGPEIQVFTLRGEAVASRTLSLGGDDPRAIGTDRSGRVFVLNTEATVTPGFGVTSFESMIDVYRGDLAPLGQLGTSGYAAGRFNFDGQVAGIAVASQNELVLAEPGNNRVQVLAPETAGRNNKAIVVAGGGDYPENFLWEATQINTNNAYDKLIYQGFTADRILYLHPDPNLDLDGNPATVEVDGAPTIDNLARAFGVTTGTGKGPDPITDFAVDADNLVVYFADHGDKEVFRVNPEEIVDSGQVMNWFDTLQGSRWPSRPQGAPLGNNGWLTVVYEACESGTFMNELAPTDGQATTKRVVITTSSSDENASFIAQGLLSFSYQFWINVFNGSDVLRAFGMAADTIADTYSQQAPMFKLIFEGVEVSGAGLDAFFESGGANFGFAARSVGNGTSNEFSGPDVVSPVATLQGNSTLRVEIASVFDADGVSRVWLIIEPPDFQVRDAQNPILELPTIDLGMDCGAGVEYCGSFDGATSSGDYRIEIMAQDVFGNVTRFPDKQKPMPDPDLVVTVGNPLRNKAALLIAGDDSERGRAQLANGDFAYRALLRQDFVNDLDPATPGIAPADDEIRYFTQGTFTGADGGTPGAGQLDALLVGGFADSGTQHFVLIITGDYGGPDVDGLAFAQGAAPLLTSELITFLDNLDGVIQGRALVVLEGDGVGALLPRLAGSNRIVVASSSPGQSASLIGAGGISFSQFFWNAIRDGFSVGTAFALSADASRIGSSQVAMLDDDGNGIANEESDRLAARSFFIGPGIARAGNGPLVGRLMPDLVIDSESQISAVLRAENVTSTSSDAGVTVIGNVAIPGTQLQLGSFPLTRTPSANKGQAVFNIGDFQGTFDGFVWAGDYEVSIFAVDPAGNPSRPRVLRVRKTAGADQYEVDDTPNAATTLVAGAAAQRHTLHTATDEDWLMFYLADAPVRVLDMAFDQLDPGLQLQLDVYDATRLTNPAATPVLTQVVDPGPVGTDVSIPDTLPGGLYFARIDRLAFTPQADSDPSPGYSVGLSSPFGDLGGLLTGTVVDASTGAPVGLALVTATTQLATLCGTPPCQAGIAPTCNTPRCGDVGAFRFLLNQGGYDVTVSASGYQSATIGGLSVSPGATTTVLPNPIALVPQGGAAPPTAVLNSAIPSEFSVTLQGTLNANGAQTTARFELGRAGSLRSPVDPGLLAAGSADQPVMTTVQGLACNTAYTVVLSAENAGGGTVSGELAFNTGACVTILDLVFGDGFENP